MIPQVDPAAPFEPYSCKIESLTKVEQKRSTNPAMDSIKRAFRSIFKRGRKSKQEDQRQSPTLQQSKPTSASAAQPHAAPPKDAVQQQAEAHEPNTTGKLPPMHPLSASRQDLPQEAVPQDHAAQASIPAVAGGPNGVQKAEGEDGTRPTTTPVKTATSEPVSAVSREEPPAPPSKVDGAADAVVAAPMEAAAAAPAVTESQPAHRQFKGEPIESPAEETAKEHAQPNGTGPMQTSGLQKTESFDDKIFIAGEEPPPIKNVRAAPGMSATSGPLEDFPEGGPYAE